MPVESLFSSLHVSASALEANRRWMDAIAENLANAQTTRTPEGGPYRRKTMTFSEQELASAKQITSFKGNLELRTTHQAHLKPHHDSYSNAAITGVAAEALQDAGEVRWVYDPEHPDANEEGYVAYPNVEIAEEMVDLITASRAYEANVTAMKAAKTMSEKALEI
ncbi:MAG: flagellar basal body rod protein FlgC [bacterium]